MLELWLRPWARVRRNGHCLPLAQHTVSISDHHAALWLYAESGDKALLVDGRPNTAEPVPGFNAVGGGRSLALMPFPLKTRPGALVTAGGKSVSVIWPDAPERPPTNLDPKTDEERASHDLMVRAQTVWDRLREVDIALANPAELWQELHRRWTEEGQGLQPWMDLIVRHAAALSRTLDELDKAPRRILRRTHQQIPLARIQELDRRCMTWLVRQPGNTLAERAGDRQRLLAIAREQNFDTLENRVLRSYCELARRVARNYLERNASKRNTRRAKRVEEFGRRCKRLSIDLADKGVRTAEPGVTPNFVLQQNPSYRAVWVAWRELLDENRTLDDLWRWQARSWEEFCAIAVVVAMVGIPNAKIISAAPVAFLNEQCRGSWVAHDNPLAVFHLPDHGIVVEVRYRMANPGTVLADFGAPIWIKIGRVGDVMGFLSYIPVWPIWDVRGGLVPGEAEEIEQVVAAGAKANIASGIVVRPISAEDVKSHDTGNVLTSTLGVDGATLWRGLEVLTHFLTNRMTRERQP